jgi:hypothetical protein
MIDVELQKYYEQRNDMFSTQGWKDLVEDVENLRKPLFNIKSIKTQDELQFRKGQIDIIDWVLGLKEMSDKAHKDLQEGEDAPV